MKLTPRLQTIADEINPGETMADIGTDHGFLPVYLWENKISPNVIMADISAGSLAKAEENCRAFFPDREFDLRLGNGLEILQPGEVDAVVMAGMGGILMSQILAADSDKSRSFSKLVLQPRKDIGVLRYWLFDNGFRIVNEKLVREGKFICEVITAVPKEIAITRQMDETDVEYEFPYSLVDFRNDLTLEYLTRKKKLEEEILTSMRQGKYTTPQALRRQEYRIYHLKFLIKEVKKYED